MIIADENIDRVIIEYLRENTYKILAIREESPGVSDPEVIENAIKNKALLITEDKDFGELVFAHNIKECSVILLRYTSPPDEIFLKKIVTAIDHNRDHPGHFFYTITPKRIRFRKI